MILSVGLHTIYLLSISLIAIMGLNYSRSKDKSISDRWFPRNISSSKMAFKRKLRILTKSPRTIRSKISNVEFTIIFSNWISIPYEKFLIFIIKGQTLEPQTTWLYCWKLLSILSWLPNFSWKFGGKIQEFLLFIYVLKLTFIE